MYNKLWLIMSVLLVGQTCLDWARTCLKMAPAIAAGARIAALSLLAYRVSFADTTTAWPAVTAIADNARSALLIAATATLIYASYVWSHGGAPGGRHVPSGQVARFSFKT